MQLIGIACLVLAPALAAADQIIKVGSPRPTAATVVSEDAKVVKFKLPGLPQTQEISSLQVQDVLYEDAPESYTRGRELLTQGDFSNAVNNLKASTSEKTRNDWVKVYGNYYLGEAYFRWGATDPQQYKNAIQTLEALLTAHPDCRFLPHALRLWGEAAARSGDADAAAAAYDRLVKEAKDRGLGLIWEARAKVLKAEAYSENGQPEKAKQVFQEAGSFALANAEAQKDADTRSELLTIAGKARLSEGVALLRGNKLADARRSFEAVAQDPKAPEEMLAGALAGLGEVLYAEGNFREAFEQFARVRVQHFLVRNETARATYFMGMCCLALKDREPGGARKARDYFTEVVSRYADTSWANRAQAEIR